MPKGFSTWTGPNRLRVWYAARVFSPLGSVRPSTGMRTGTPSHGDSGAAIVRVASPASPSCRTQRNTNLHEGYPFRTSPSDRHVRLGQCMLLSAGWYNLSAEPL